MFSIILVALTYFHLAWINFISLMHSYQRQKGVDYVAHFDVERLGVQLCGLEVASGDSTQHLQELNEFDVEVAIVEEFVLWGHLAHAKAKSGCLVIQTQS